MRNENSRRQRGNPNWGKPFIDVPNLPTKFELAVGDLNLDIHDHERLAESSGLREWARRNRSYRFVPESLLTTWNLELDEDSL